MGVELSSRLVVGISTSALFDLKTEDRIFKEQGLEAFRRFQDDHEEEVLNPGTGFALIRALLSFNQTGHDRDEVIIMSRNHPDLSLRVSNSIKRHGLNISRKALTGGHHMIVS